MAGGTSRSLCASHTRAAGEQSVGVAVAELNDKLLIVETHVAVVALLFRIPRDMAKLSKGFFLSLKGNII